MPFRAFIILMKESLTIRLGCLNVSIALAVRTSKVNVESYTWTADSNILCQMLSHEEGAVVTENGKNIDINEPLSDGLHELTVMRQSHGRSSESVFMDVRVNSAPPTVTFDYEDISIKHGNERNTYITSVDKFFVSGKVSEGVAEVYLDGEPAQTYDGYLFIMGDLDFGSNIYEITLIDGVGNKTVDCVTINRTGN